LYTIDNLFALPAPLALLKTFIHPRGSLFFPILSSVLIQALVLVSILAPSALTVAPSQQVSRNIEVSIFNLTSQARFADAGFIVQSDYLSVFSVASPNLSALGDKTINSVMLNLPELIWAIPQGCGLKCAFYFKYNAPGLECHDIIFSDDRDLPYLHAGDNIYETNTNLYAPWNTTASSNQQIALDAPYDLSINYTGVTNAFLPNMTFAPRAGTYCRFYKATYNASFELDSNSGTRRASTSIINHGDYLSPEKTAAGATSFNDLQEWVASWAICYAFTQAFSANYTINSAEYLTRAQPLLASIFSINITASTYSFDLTVSNLSQTLVNLFSNLTLGLISTRGGQDPVIANATIWDGSSVWNYTPGILLIAYLPTVILANAVALYGLCTIHSSGIAMDDKFSSFLLATQNEKLYEMCGEAADFEELQRLTLIHQNKGTFNAV
jgi:hypothetical protein